jgi:hypothetical protein
MEGVLAEAWAMYKAHARHLLSIAFVVYVVAAVIETLFGLLGVIGALLAAIVSIIAAFLLQAALVKAVEDVRDGRVDLTFGETLQSARPAVGRVAVTSIVAGIAIAIGLVLLLVPGLYLLTIWAVIVPVIVLEGAGTGAAFSRSQALVKGYFWQVFGTLILVFIVLFAVSIVISLILVALPAAVRQLISGVVSGTLVSPFLALVLTLGYFRLLAAHGGSAPEGTVEPPPYPGSPPPYPGT